jgi:hypothetical protein
MEVWTMSRYWLAGAAALALTVGAASAQEILPRTAIVAQPAPSTVVIVPAAPLPPPVVTVAPAPQTVVAVPPAPIVDVPPGAVAVTKSESTVDANGVRTDKVQTYQRKESYGYGNGALTSDTRVDTTGQTTVYVPGTTTTTTTTWRTQ